LTTARLRASPRTATIPTAAPTTATTAPTSTGTNRKSRR
jgi:hypothetical protein